MELRISANGKPKGKWLVEWLGFISLSANENGEVLVSGGSDETPVRIWNQFQE